MKKFFDDIKTGLKLVKFGIQYKQMVVISIIFFICGLLFIVIGGPTQIMLGMLYLVMSLSYFSQPYMSTSVASCVASSPIHRAMFVNVPVAINAIGANVGYLVGVIVIVLRIKLFDGYSLRNGQAYSTSQIAAIIIICGVVALGIQVYVIACYKYFVASMIAFFVLFFGLYGFVEFFLTKAEEININLILAIVVAWVCIWVGNALAFAFAKLNYKKALDPWYYKRAIANGLK